VRIVAYEALRAQRNVVVQTYPMMSALDTQQINCWLDIVESSGPPLIYIRRSGSPRIALIGTRAECRRPVFYTHPSGWVTINAAADASDVTLFRRTRRSGRLSEPLNVAPRAAEIIRAMAALPVKDQYGRTGGLGLGYAQVVSVLCTLSRNETLASRLVLEQTPTRAETAPTERPEAELPEAAQSAESEFDMPPDADLAAGTQR
jgi:hypothetical protein